MAFFGLSEIRFEHSDQRTYGPLSALEGTPFKYNTLKYPLDVGAPDKGHYMIFFVREQEKTQFSAAARGAQVFSAKEEQAIQDQLSKGNSVANKISTSKIKNNFADKVNKGLENLISTGTSAISQNFGTAGAKVGGAIDKFFSKNNPAQVSLAEQKNNDNITKSIKSITDKSPMVL